MNNAFATPKEARIARKELVCIFDTEAVPSVLAGEIVVNLPEMKFTSGK